MVAFRILTVNGAPASRYADSSFAAAGFTLASGPNSFTNIATDLYGFRFTTNTLTVNLPATVSFSYDLNGNLRSDGLRTFAYDDENQLINVTVAGQWKTDFVYDGLMRRRLKREFSWTGSAWQQTNEVRYVYDGLLVLQERDALNVPLVTYTRGLDLSSTRQGAGGIGGLLARTDHATSDPQLSTAYYHADGNGNITALLGASSQDILGRYHYDPFGALLAKSGPLAEANLKRDLQSALEGN